MSEQTKVTTKKRKYEREEITESAVALVRLIVENRPDDALLVHVRELLSILIWKVTEADGKNNTQFWSEKYFSNQLLDWEHEHVFERKKLIQSMLDNPSQASEILLSAAACVVTCDEHKALTEASKRNENLNGWDRYREAGIRVWDRKSNCFLW